jgi:hypothetical protein
MFKIDFAARVDMSAIFPEEIFAVIAAISRISAVEAMRKTCKRLREYIVIPPLIIDDGGTTSIKFARGIEAFYAEKHRVVQVAGHDTNVYVLLKCSDLSSVRRVLGDRASDICVLIPFNNRENMTEHAWMDGDDDEDSDLLMSFDCVDEVAYITCDSDMELCNDEFVSERIAAILDDDRGAEISVCVHANNTWWDGLWYPGWHSE